MFNDAFAMPLLLRTPKVPITEAESGFCSVSAPTQKPGLAPESDPSAR
jgi:hypothetical protein